MDDPREPIFSRAVRSAIGVLGLAALVMGGCSCVSGAEASEKPERLVGSSRTSPAPVDVPAAGDADGDGIEDARELVLARTYFPFYSMDPADECPRHGVLFRLSPHPEDGSKVLIRYVVLFERDCGLYGIGAHVGDNEVFSAVVDPGVPPPGGILALRAIAHQSTTCERETSCGSLPGCRACETADIGGRAYPVVFSSRNKHGQHVSELACDTWPCDFASCTRSSVPAVPELVNAGEPGRPLCNDLTANGFVTAERGWTEPSLLNFDPWGGRKFGTAGVVTEDLMDDAFLIPLSGC